jgi:hypothetical protein
VTKALAQSLIIASLQNRTPILQTIRPSHPDIRREKNIYCIVKMASYPLRSAYQSVAFAAILSISAVRSWPAALNAQPLSKLILAHPGLYHHYLQALLSSLEQSSRSMARQNHETIFSMAFMEGYDAS